MRTKLQPGERGVAKVGFECRDVGDGPLMNVTVGIGYEVYNPDGNIISAGSIVGAVDCLVSIAKELVRGGYEVSLVPGLKRFHALTYSQFEQALRQAA